MELLQQGDWAPACSAALSPQAATVLCQQLGLGNKGAVVPGSPYGTGTGVARLQSISCLGTEEQWEDCTAAIFNTATCGGSGVAGLVCTGLPREFGKPLPSLALHGRIDRNAAWLAVTALLCGDRALCFDGKAFWGFLYAETVRLVRDPTSTADPTILQGRLEVKQGSKWSTVCDDGKVFLPNLDSNRLCTTEVQPDSSQPGCTPHGHCLQALPTPKPALFAGSSAFPATALRSPMRRWARALHLRRSGTKCGAPALRPRSRSVLTPRHRTARIRRT